MSRMQRERGGRRGWQLGLAAGAVFACLALGVRAATARAASTPEVVIQNFRFDPPTLEVSAGATVTWINRDEEVHAVTSTQGLFHSPGLDGNATFSFRFDKPGTYEYRCALHPQMQGTVVVR